MKNKTDLKLTQTNVSESNQKSAVIIKDLNLWPRKSLADTFVKRVNHSSSFTLF